MIYFLDAKRRVISSGCIRNMSFQIVPFTEENIDISEIEYALVDGSELYFAMNILSRKFSNRKVFTFYGEDARTIAANWK